MYVCMSEAICFHAMMRFSTSYGSDRPCRTIISIALSNGRQSAFSCLTFSCDDSQAHDLPVQPEGVQAPQSQEPEVSQAQSKEHA
jgi:hypothetical protein